MRTEFPNIRFLLESCYSHMYVCSKFTKKSRRNLQRYRIYKHAKIVCELYDEKDGWEVS